MTFTREDLVDRYSGSLLGGLWSLLMPLVNILIYTLVFSRIMGMRLAMDGMETSRFSYSVYLVSGLLAWQCFGNTVRRMSTVYQNKAGIIKKVSLDLRLLPLYLVASELTIYVISMAFFVVFLLTIDHPLAPAFAWLPVIVLLQQVLAYALGLAAGSLSIFLPDVKEFVDIVLNVWFWLTPIVYVGNILSEFWQGVMVWNPAFHFVEAYRQVILAGEAPATAFLLVSGGACVILMAAVLFVSKKLEQDIRDFV